MKLAAVLLFFIFMTGCQINPWKDFYQYGSPSEKELIGTYQYHDEIYGGPFYVLKLNPDKSFIKFTVYDGITAEVCKGVWDYKDAKSSGYSQDYLNLTVVRYVNKKRVKGGFGGGSEPVRKRIKDGKIFIYGAGSVPGMPSEDEYVQIKAGK